ncbi:MAG: hypothetical protein ACK5M3_13665 [Dysgonomonas sp.]
MKKYTVKHYLNTKIKAKQIDQKEWYPIYIQIIYNKFSTDKKSSADILVTKKGFDHYLKTGHLQESETTCFLVSRIALKKAERDLEKELIDIECSIDIIKKWSLPVARRNIINVINNLSEEARRAISEQYRINTDIYVSQGSPSEDNYNTEYEDFTLCFSNNIVESIEKIKKYTNIDLKPFLKEDTIINSEALLLVAEVQTNFSKKQKRFRSFAEFVESDYKTEIKRCVPNKSLEYFDSIIVFIEKMINDYIDDTEIFYCS